MASNPEIPSFKNPQGQPPKEAAKPAEPQAKPQPEKSEEKKGGGVSPFSRPATAAKTPAFGTPTPAPAVRIRGLSGGPKTLFDRLKQFQKKDLIFIASGLGVLFMAPLAEHFMMSPSTDKSLQPGFSSPGGSMFNGEVGPHEPGTGGMAPGGLVGSGSDVITPLNVRDPSALIMAPGGSQVTPPPAATTVAPPAASASRDSGGWKDALSAAKAGAEKGADAAKPGAFRAPGNIAGALRGLSALSGGSYGGGPTYSLSAPNASNVPNRGSTGGGLSQVTSAPGYKGVGARGLDSGGNAESLRRAAEGAGDRFNRGGGAAGNLEAAARETIPGGAGNGGASGAGAGGENKGGSGSTNKDNKALGESLAYLRMKMEMEKEMDLKWSKKKWKEFEFPKMIYEEITKSAIQNILGKGMFEPFGKAMADMWKGAAGATTGARCIYKDGDGYGSQDFASNDGSDLYCGPQGQVWEQPLDDKGNPKGAPNQKTGLSGGLSCFACTPLGGSKNKGSGAGTQDKDLVKDTKGSKNSGSAQDIQQAGGSLETSRAELEGFLKTCPKEGDQQTEAKGPDAKLCAMARLLPAQYDAIKSALDDVGTVREKLNTSWDRMGDAVNGLTSAAGAMQDAQTWFGAAADKSDANTVFGKGLKIQETLNKDWRELVKIDGNDSRTKGPLETAGTLLEAARKAKTQGDGFLAVAVTEQKKAVDAVGSAKSALDAGDITAKRAAATLKKVGTDLDGLADMNVGNSTQGRENLVQSARKEADQVKSRLTTLAGSDPQGQIGGELKTARNALDQRVIGAANYTCQVSCAVSGQATSKAPAPTDKPDAYAASLAAKTGGVGVIGGGAVTTGGGDAVPLKMYASPKEHRDRQATQHQLVDKLDKAIPAAQTGGGGGKGGELQVMQDAVAAAKSFIETNTAQVSQKGNCPRAQEGTLKPAAK